MTGQHREAERDPWAVAFGLLLLILLLGLVVGVRALL